MSLMSWLKNLFSPAERPKQVALGRNDLCWCGSGKKYKKCHLDSDAAKDREANYAALFAKKTQGDGITRSGRKAPLPPENTSPQPRR